MAKYRQSTILPSEAMDASGTITIDILEVDPISRIDIIQRAKNSESTPTAHPCAIISKIELVDGSDVLFSCSGKQATAMAYYGTGKIPCIYANYLNGVESITQYHIYFGRHLWDEKYALVPGRFTSLQLKITYNRTAGGAAPGSGTFKAVAQLFDEKSVSPVGFLQTKEVISYTGSSTAWKYVDIPTDYPIRILAFQAEYAGANPNSVTNKVRLVEDNGKKVPLEEFSVSDYMKIGVFSTYGTINEQVITRSTASGETGYNCLCYQCVTSSSSDDLAHVDYGQLVSVAGGSFTYIQSAGSNQKHNIVGMIPFGVVPIIQIADPTKDEDFYDVTDKGSVQLQLYGGGSAGSGTEAVLIQQIRSL